MRLVRDKGDLNSTLVLEAENNAKTNQIIKKIIAKLFQNRRYLKALPLPFLLTVAKPGRGFHVGGTFPMKHDPGPFESDVYGRPHGLKRVHAVDSTVFPSIPAGTVALSIMANAHRIASLCDRS